MNYSDKKFIEDTMRAIRNRIPYPATWEQHEFAEELQNEIGKMLGSRGYHIAKHSEDMRKSLEAKKGESA